MEKEWRQHYRSNEAVTAGPDAALGFSAAYSGFTSLAATVGAM